MSLALIQPHPSCVPLSGSSAMGSLSCHPVSHLRSRQPLDYDVPSSLCTRHELRDLSPVRRCGVGSGTGGNGKGVVAATQTGRAPRVGHAQAGRCAFCLGSMQRNATHTRQRSHTPPLLPTTVPSHTSRPAKVIVDVAQSQSIVDARIAATHTHQSLTTLPLSTSRPISLRRPQLLPDEEDPSRTLSTWSRRLRRG